jgi:putative ATPase
MRPRTLEQFVGQQHFLGEGMLLRRMLTADRLTSVLFYGPPGTGKTTLAEVIAGHTGRHFARANAASVGVKDVREVLDAARRRLELDGKRTIYFLDEIHRFNKAQQDVLLGDVERGIITLIGATTENPFFAVNSALVSRSQVFQFEPLSPQDIERVIRQALEDDDRGYGRLHVTLDDDALAHWATASDGDARRALSALEVAVESQVVVGRDEETKRQRDEVEDDAPASSLRDSVSSSLQAPIHITLPIAEQSIQQKAVVYDATGDEHYDTISAFIKSVRGSDPDAAVYWLARMLHAGEDPMYIARRIAILASEDIGNADPRGITVAAAAYEITHRIGMPECQLTLAQATIYLACAPKSNATATAIWTAMSDVKHQRTVPVPKHLRDGHYAGAEQLGHTGYRYSHNAPGGVNDQEYLGVDKTYYQPTDRGYEQRLGQYLEWVRRLQASEPQPDAPAAGQA